MVHCNFTLSALCYLFVYLFIDLPKHQNPKLHYINIGLFCLFLLTYVVTGNCFYPYTITLHAIQLCPLYFMLYIHYSKSDMKPQLSEVSRG